MNKLKNIFLQAAFFINCLLIFLVIFEHKLINLPKWMQFTGRLHPMLLHFPIALMLLLLLFEWIGPKHVEGSHSDDKSALLLAITACSASITALCGLLLYHTGSYEQGATLKWHKWTGIAAALVTWLLIWLRTTRFSVYRFMLVASVFVIVIAGHLGSNITHGENFLTQPFEIKKQKIADINQAMVFTDIIQPILDEKCTGCHNPNKTKGGLQLISKQTILKGGEDGEVLVPGSPDSSMLYRFLLLPMNDDKHMPPEGKPQLDAEEVELFHWWISSGASFDNTLAALSAPDSIKKIVQDKYGQGSPLDALEIAFAKTSTIQSLNTTSRGVRQLSVDKPYIDVFLGNKKDLKNKDLEDLKEVSGQVVSLDLSNSSVKDDQLGIISAFPHLRKLYLENTDVSDKGIQKLGNLKYLEYLNVSNTNVTDQVFRELTPYTSLQKLFLYGTNVPVPAITAFKAKKPGMQIGYTPDLSLDTSFRGRLTQPDVTIDSTLFTHVATVEMKYRLKGVAIHYTTNGKDPDSSSAVYSKPISIDSTCNLRVIAIKKGWEKSPVQAFSLLRARYSFVAAKLSTLPDKSYRARLDTTLIDLQRGEDHGDGKYLGYHGDDVTVDLDLGQAKPLHSIQVSYIQNHDAYVMAPASVEVYGSRDGTNFTRLASANHDDKKMMSGAIRGTLATNFHETEARYIRVKIMNRKKLPSWHPGKGQKSWMFIDEIVSG